MKVESQASGPCRMKLTIRTDAAETRPDYEEVVALFIRHGKLPGFRPGHAPRAIVERHYRQQIDAEAREQLIGKFCRQAITESKLAAVAVIDVSDVIFSPELGMAFTALVDVAPDFKLPKYKKIPLKAETTAISDAQVEERINALRKMLMEYKEDAADGMARRDDIIQVAYTVTCEGKPLQECAPAAAPIADNPGDWIRVAASRDIPGLALALEGANIGESRAVDVAFGQDYPIEALRGKTARYEARVLAVRHGVPPSDEAFCQRLGVADMVAAREACRKQLQNSAEQQEQNRQRQEIIDFILKRTPFDLPQSVVADETRFAVRSMVQEIIERGGTRENLEQSRDAILESASANAKDRVRLRYILTRIADEEKIEATDAEIEQWIADTAARDRMSAEKLRAAIEERHGFEAIRTELRCGKALDFLRAEAAVA